MKITSTSLIKSSVWLWFTWETGLWMTIRRYYDFENEMEIQQASSKRSRLVYGGWGVGGQIKANMTQSRPPV